MVAPEEIYKVHCLPESVDDAGIGYNPHRVYARIKNAVNLNTFAIMNREHEALSQGNASCLVSLQTG
jgi:hypothetical protein